MAPRLATAMTEMAFGMPLAVSVVPSIGSTATSYSRPLPSPTCSPLNSMGALSFSPSPMTTTPFMLTVEIMARIASTAAPSALFFSTPAHPATTRHRRRLGDAHELEGKVAIGRLVLHLALRLCASRSAPAYRGGDRFGGSAGLGDDGPMTVPETVSTTDAPRPSRYSLGSLPNMLRSLLFIGLLVAGLVAIVPGRRGAPSRRRRLAKARPR